MSVIYYIDAENVQLKGILELLKESTNLVVVVTGVHNKFEDEYKEAQNYKNLDHIHTTKTQKELADKLLLAKLGEYVYRFRTRKHVIISKDNDFRDAVKVLNPHWGSDVQILPSYPTAAIHPTKASRSSSQSTLGRKNPSEPATPRSPSHATGTQSADPFSEEARIRRIADRFQNSEHFRTARSQNLTTEDFIEFLLRISIVSSEDDAKDLLGRLAKVGAIQINGTRIDWKSD